MVGKKQHIWQDCNIPAKLFFKVINTGDYTLLGKGKSEVLEKSFYKILDEFCIIDDNKAIIEAYQKSAKAMVTRLQIALIKEYLYHLTFVKMSKDVQDMFIDKLNSISGVVVEFSKVKPLFEEINRVETKVIGRLINQMNIDEADSDKGKKKAESNFYDELVNIINVLDMSNVNEDLSLYLFISLKKQARAKIEAIKKSKKQ